MTPHGRCTWRRYASSTMSYCCDTCSAGTARRRDPGKRPMPVPGAWRPTPCAELIISAGLHRVVIAWLEPPVFAPGGGAALLREAGITVVEAPGLAAEARAVNAAVLSEQGPAS